MPKSLPELATTPPILPSVDTASQETSSPSEADFSPMFQAIGTLQALIEREENGRFFICIGGRKYNLYIPYNRIKAWFKQIEATPDTPLFLRVYPKCQIVPQKEPEIRFQVVAWGSENRWEEQSGEFIFKGIWQFVPQLRTPCVSIYRNNNATDPTEKFKASHLPVLMRREDEDIRPFRFNPKIPKENLPKRYFVEARFRFIPSKNCWGWIQDIKAPSDRIPRYKKPVKATSVEQKKEH
jgi:hypothetical protein